MSAESSLDRNSKAFSTDLSPAQLLQVAIAANADVAGGVGTELAVRDWKKMTGGLGNTNLRLDVQVKDHNNASGGAQESALPRLHAAQAASGSLLVKVCDEKTTSELRDFAALLEHLRRHNFDTAFPVQLKNHGANGEGGAAAPDDFILKVDGIPNDIMVFAFLRGATRAFSEVTERAVRDVAGDLAKLHMVPVPTEKELGGAQLPAFAMGLPQMKPFLDSDEGRPFVDAPFVTLLRERMVPRFEEQTVAQVRAANEAMDGSVPLAVVHADCFPDNCLFEPLDAPGEGGRELVAIIDFEEVCADAALLDVGMTIIGFCFPRNNELDETLYDAFVDEYSKHRPLSDAERRLLPEFCAYAAGSCAFWRWRQFNVRHPEDVANRNRHEEMVQRMEMFWARADKK